MNSFHRNNKETEGVSHDSCDTMQNVRHNWCWLLLL